MNERAGDRDANTATIRFRMPRWMRDHIERSSLRGDMSAHLRRVYAEYMRVDEILKQEAEMRADGKPDNRGAHLVAMSPEGAILLGQCNACGVKARHVPGRRREYELGGIWTTVAPECVSQ